MVHTKLHKNLLILEVLILILPLQNFDLLNLMFFVSYILVKENLYEYNIKETLAIAKKIEEVNSEMFEYPELKAELEKLLQNDSEI